MQIRDPQTGKVPLEDATLVKEQLYQQQVASKQEEEQAVGNEKWIALGPTEVGCRIRTLLLMPTTYQKAFAGTVGGGLWRCDNIKATTPMWKPVCGAFDNLAVTALAIQPTNSNVLYMGTGEGWYNPGAFGFGLGLGTNYTRGKGIYKSTNGGNTWSKLTTTETDTAMHYIQKIVVLNDSVASNNDIVFVATLHGLYRSTNGGTSFTKVLYQGNGGINFANSPAFNSVSDIEIAANGDVYVSIGILQTDGIFKATFNGTNTGSSGSWIKLGGGLPTTGYERIELACAPSSAATVYAVYQAVSNVNDDKNCLNIYKTVNNGTTWALKSEPWDNDVSNSTIDWTGGQAFYNLSAAVDPNNAATIYVGAFSLHRSTDSGNSDTWKKISDWNNTFPNLVHPDQHIILFEPSSSSQCYVGNDGGIYRSSNVNTATNTDVVFNKINKGMNVTQFYSCAITPTNNTFTFLGGTQDNDTHKITNISALANTTTLPSEGDGGFCFISQTNSSRMISSYTKNNYYATLTGTAPFTFIDAGTDATKGLFINPTDYDSTNDYMYSSGDANTIIRWKNMTTWAAPQRNTLQIGTAMNGLQASHIKVSPNNTTNPTVYIGTTGGRIIRVPNASTCTASSPGAVNITSNLATALPNGAYVSCIEVKQGATDAEIIVTFSNYGIKSVWRTTNGTSASPTWVSLDEATSLLPNVPIRWALFTPGTAANEIKLLLATEVGVWGTTNLSATPVTWEQVSTGMGNVRTNMLKMRSSDNMIVAATFGRGLFRSDMFSPVKVDFRSLSPIIGANCDFTITADNSVGATSWAWDINNDGTTESTDQTYFISGGALDYPVKLTINGNISIVKYLCDIVTISGTPCLPHKTASTDAAVKVAPNPTKNTFSLMLEESSAENRLISATIFDLLGRIVLETSDLTAIDLSRQAEGMYIWQAKSSNGSIYKGRIVKQ